MTVLSLVTALSPRGDSLVAQPTGELGVHNTDGGYVFTAPVTARELSGTMPTYAQLIERAELLNDIRCDRWVLQWESYLSEDATRAARSDVRWPGDAWDACRRRCQCPDWAEWAAREAWDAAYEAANREAL